MGLIEDVVELVDVYDLNGVCSPSLLSRLRILGVVERRHGEVENCGHGGSEHSAHRHFLVPARDSRFGSVWLQLGHLNSDVCFACVQSGSMAEQ